MSVSPGCLIFNQTHSQVNVHSLVDFVNCKPSMDLLHSCASIFHGIQSLLIDIRRFDRIYLLLDLRRLCRGLLK